MGTPNIVYSKYVCPTPQNNIETVQSYPELNWLRGFAAIAVMLFHYTVRYDQILGHRGNWNVTVPWGGAMVVSFFILSGFLGILSSETSAKNYLKKRIIRLYPVYWICILCTVMVMKIAFPLYDQLPDSSIALKDILLNLTMLQGILLQPSVDGAYWTLGIDLRFYLFYFLILLFRKRNPLENISSHGFLYLCC